MKKYVYIFLTSLIIFQAAVVFMSEESIRYSLGPSSAKIMMNSMGASSPAVTLTFRFTLSRFYRLAGSLFCASQQMLSSRSAFVHASFIPLPSMLDKDSLTAAMEHLFLPVLDLTLLI